MIYDFNIDNENEALERAMEQQRMEQRQKELDEKARINYLLLSNNGMDLSIYNETSGGTTITTELTTGGYSVKADGSLTHILEYPITSDELYTQGFDPFKRPVKKYSRRELGKGKKDK